MRSPQAALHPLLVRTPHNASPTELGAAKAKGLSVRQIAGQYGLGVGTVQRITSAQRP
jgi:hypothetical protein